MLGVNSNRFGLLFRPRCHSAKDGHLERAMIRPPQGWMNHPHRSKPQFPRTAMRGFFGLERFRVAPMIHPPQG